jgi:serine/threonine-protein kinase
MISHLGRYEIIGELGQGAMGIVYKAKDPLIDRILAIKTISLDLALGEKAEYEARFYQEAKAAGRLSHPNIVTVYDVGKSGDVAYIAMEFLQGRELHEILQEGNRLPISLVLDIVKQVALGLSYAHEHGIVHRDVKPSNIMVIRDWHVKITDFGIARMASSTVQTQAGVVLGSPKYMSPEQVLGKSIDQRSDIFSLGVMLYEMLAGQPPFSGESINSVMYQTMNVTPPPPGTLNSNVPEMLDFIVSKALAKELNDRYQNAREFAEDLRACRESLPRESTPPAIKRLLPDNLTGSIPVSTSLPSQIEFDLGESKPLANIKLSNNFDSAKATMRLAAMTAPEESDKISRTIKMTRPSQAAYIQAGNLPLPDDQENKTNKSEAISADKLLLLILILLVLLGVVVLL